MHHVNMPKTGFYGRIFDGPQRTSAGRYRFLHKELGMCSAEIEIVYDISQDASVIPGLVFSAVDETLGKGVYGEYAAKIIYERLCNTRFPVASVRIKGYKQVANAYSEIDPRHIISREEWSAK
ncbi:hypothetical protein EPN87_01180 [archaeon]|nr:MAG: hypothetical protein EPN87_01180 [archaeon]